MCRRDSTLAQLAQQVEGGCHRRGRKYRYRTVRDHPQLVDEDPVAVVEEVTVDVGTSGSAPGLGISGHERRGLEAETLLDRMDKVGEETGVVQIIGPGKAEHGGGREPDVHRDGGMPLGGTDHRLHLVQRGPVRPQEAVGSQRWRAVDGAGDSDQQWAMGSRLTLRDDGQVDQRLALIHL